MNEITRQSVRAFRNGESFKKSNTEVEVKDEFSRGKIVKMYLFNNLIAKRFETICASYFYISAAGQRTNTTKERLNGFPGVEIYQKDWLWYLNGEYWDGEWIQIK